MRFKEYVELHEFQPTNDENILLEKVSNLIIVARELGVKEHNKGVHQKFVELLHEELEQYREYKVSISKKKPFEKIFPVIETKIKEKFEFDLTTYHIDEHNNNKRIIFTMACVNFMLETVFRKLKHELSEHLALHILEIITGGLSHVLELCLNAHKIKDLVKISVKVAKETRELKIHMDELRDYDE